MKAQTYVLITLLHSSQVAFFRQCIFIVVFFIAWSNPPKTMPSPNMVDYIHAIETPAVFPQ